MLRTGILFVLVLGTSLVTAVGQESARAHREEPHSIEALPTSGPAPAAHGNEPFGQATQLVRAGNKSWSAGDSLAAIAEFRKASELEPGLYVAQYNLAVAYLSRGEYRLALKPLERLVRMKANSVELLQYLGCSYYEVKDFENAVKCFEQASKLAPNSSLPQNNLGYAHLNLYQIGAAEAAFKESLQLTPGFKPSIMGLCLTYGLAKNNALAMGFCSKARQLSPEVAVPNYFIGLAKFDAGQYAEALAFFLQARILQPEYAPIFVAIGFTQHKLKYFKEALASFERAAELEPSEQAFNGKGSVYFSLKEYNKAEEAFRQALAITPDSFQARFNLGMACLIQENRDCALQQYNFLKMFNPPLADRLFKHMFAGRVLDARVQQKPEKAPPE